MPLLTKSVRSGELSWALEATNLAVRVASAQCALKQIKSIVDDDMQDRAHEISTLIDYILQQSADYEFDQHANLLLEACRYCFDIGLTRPAIDTGRKIVERARTTDNLTVERRASNMLGLHYGDVSDFASAMKFLQSAIQLARKLKSPLLEAASLANVVAVLQEMGHYRHAMSLATKVLALDDESADGRLLKLQCASNGLFSAHRICSHESARQFLEHGERNLDSNTLTLNRMFFERNRAFYLIDTGRSVEANVFIKNLTADLGEPRNARVRILLSIAGNSCAWGSGEKELSRTRMRRLYAETRQSRLYHHFVLQALVKILSDSTSNAELAEGLDYARELVEFTTGVKRAKFYRQLQVQREAHDAAVASVTDAFIGVHDWLNASDTQGPWVQDEERRPELTKHEELSAIHEDMARIRVATLRRDIRTKAVDTAENWAIAAELFDDETGQHCYRVGHLASMLARELAMDETFCMQVEHAARLHDIGKIAVNELILLKPGPLDATEMAAMRLHTEVGAQMLMGSDDPTLVMATDIARHHHEWWNGSGYPSKFSGLQIPVAARICAYADVYDALTHARAYKNAWSHDRALQEILRLRGVQFDPGMSAAFVNVLGRYQADLDRRAIPGFADMDANALITSRKELLATIAGHA